MRRFALVIILFFPYLVAADGTLYVVPERGTYVAGQQFQMRVLADTGGRIINAAEAELDFDPRAVSVQSISTVGSILDSWSTQPTYSNSQGTIEFSGWASKTFTGKDGLLVTITFKAIRNSSGNARFAAGAILAADGKESNIISKMKSATFTITGAAPVISVPQKVNTKQDVSVMPTAEQKREIHVSQDQVVSSSPLNTEVIEDGVVRPEPPSLAEYPRTVAVGNRIYIKGSADPDTPIRVYLRYGDNSPRPDRLMSAADGSFAYASDELVRPGVYYAWVIEERGSVLSEPTRTIKIDVTSQAGLSASVREAAALLEASLPFLLILGFFGLSIAYFLHKGATSRTRNYID